MVVPLVILAAGAALAGYAGKIPFTAPRLAGRLPGAGHRRHSRATKPTADITASGSRRSSWPPRSRPRPPDLGIAWRLWGSGRGTAYDEALARRLPRLYRLVENKYFVDEIYDRLVVRPLRATARFCWKVIDSVFIDGGLHVLAFVTELAGDLGRFSTTGNVRQYALYFFAGVLALFWWMIF